MLKVMTVKQEPCDLLRAAVGTALRCRRFDCKVSKDAFEADPNPNPYHCVYSIIDRESQSRQTQETPDLLRFATSSFPEVVFELSNSEKLFTLPAAWCLQMGFPQSEQISWKHYESVNCLRENCVTADNSVASAFNCVEIAPFALKLLFTVYFKEICR